MTKKLSELILEGCQQTVPIKEKYILNSTDGCGACAIGAAYAAATGIYAHEWDTFRILRTLKQVTATNLRDKVKHPLTGSEDTIVNVVVDLNDYRDWTREAIAEWLKGLGL